MNREEWLSQVAKSIAALFKQRGLRVQSYRVSCGWPSRNALGKRSQAIGECTSRSCSPRRTHEIFISPLLKDSDKVAGVLAHELVHAAVGVEHEHGDRFKRACAMVGLQGRPQQASPGPKLVKQIKAVITHVGKYPHAGITMRRKPKKAAAKRAAKLQCSQCGCKANITLKWLEQAGLPTCGCGNPFGVETPDG